MTIGGEEMASGVPAQAWWREGVERGQWWRKRRNAWSLMQ